MENNTSKTEVATLGGGCFWCLEAIYIDLKGVEKVVSGYAGGSQGNPTYQEVSRGASGHAEVVQVTFKPDEISYEDLLNIFFTIHDPTTLNRQGADVGSQYRSLIFYHDDPQRITAEKVMAGVESEGIWNNSLVTQLEPFSEFFVAEEYHQEYFKRNPEQGYCQVMIAPKVIKFRESFADRLKA